MARTTGPFIETTSIVGKKFLQHRAHLAIEISKNKMHVITHKTPRDNGHALLFATRLKKVQKLPAIVIVFKNDLLARTTGSHMIITRHRFPITLHSASSQRPNTLSYSVKIRS